MQSRAVRLILLFLFFVAISTASFLFWKGSTQAAGAALAARTFDDSARTIERSLLDLRTAQLAYAAAGQPADRWIAKVSAAVENGRTAVQRLRAEATTPEAHAALDQATGALNDFAKSDKRAAEYARTEQRLLASDVVFGDGLEQTGAALDALEQARVSEVQKRESSVGVFQSRQVFALTAGAAASVLVVLLLVPGVRPTPAAAPVSLSKPAEPARAVERERAPDLEIGIASPPSREHLPETLEPSVAPLEPELQSISEMAETVPPATTVDTPALPLAMQTDFGGVASLCADLARVVDTRALPSLLDRAAGLLDASGIILWIADPDGRELNPIFAQGYPQQLVNRLGTIPKDAENATAAAFRTSLLQTVMADEISSGAIAAPLVTPGGCVGVMAAEVRHDSERQDAKLAAATIVAAQLATLVGPPSARPQARTASNA